MKDVFGIIPHLRKNNFSITKKPPDEPVSSEGFEGHRTLKDVSCIYQIDFFFQTSFLFSQASWYSLPIERNSARKNIPNIKLGAVPKYWSILKPR